uniref:Uncharacterized protein n=1 Tax=Neobacillus citreus TaxID=2833578 RepID=A0A942SYN9_9BACI
MLEHVGERDDDDDRVEYEEHGDESDGDADGFLEALEEHDAEQEQQRERDRHRDVGEPVRSEGVLGDVRGRVRRRERHRDHEVGHGEPEQHEHQQLAGPPGQELLQHHDGAGTLEAVLRDPAVDRQCAEQCHEHEHDRGDRRQQPGGEGGDRGLVPQRREVVDTGQAHDPPPRVGLLHLDLVRALVRGAALGPLQHPPAQAGAAVEGLLGGVALGGPLGVCRGHESRW